MATGDQSDVLSRVKSILPGRWFSSSSATTGPSQTPVLDGVLSGFAALGSWAYGLIQYVRKQTRIATATDGWLDIASLDYFGSGSYALPRNPGETDAAYSARLRANLFLPANKRAAIQAALQKLTGYPVRMIEPWQPNDTFCWGRGYWGVDTTAAPGQWSNGAARYQGFVKCVLPLVSVFGNTPFLQAWGKFFWGTTSAWWFNQVAPFSGGAQLVYALIQRLKVKGTIVWVQFVPPPSPTIVLTTDSGSAVLIADGSNTVLTN